MLTVTTACYAALLAGGLAGLEWWGERNWFLSLALFAPPWMMLAPIPVLFLWAVLVRRWRMLIVHLLCVAIVLFGYMSFRWTTRPARGSATLTLVTHNVGQGNKQQFRNFLKGANPDVILLQDAKFRAGEYARRFPDKYVAARGEFVCVSRHLIQQAALVDLPQWKGRPVAARFEILVQGRPVAVYNVHLPTPRPQFNRIMSRRLLTQFFGEEEEQAGPFTGYRSWIAARVKLAEQLAERIASERRPYIAAGDFNMPDHGHIYHRFADRMTDAFDAAGRGWGLTFPGGIKNPAGILAPWLRIDFVFAGKGWTPVFCEAEPGHRSQHRAVLAMLTPSSSE